ncbi:MAG TPA: 3-hydroxybutyryl-CoA dehydrogenase [Deltaproteobacteria bacterium]|nr:3-hydroxybutyryl-CoA dehydrogenase [Deltaproteobacteria bacterium]
MSIKNIMVVGAGLMGSGISQIAAGAGYQVIINDVKDELVEKGLTAISQNLDRQVKKEKIAAADKDAILAKITKSASLDDARKADFVIEAAFEDFAVKKSIFEKLDGICPAGVIFASNTSSIPISSLATTVKRPDKFIGMHFFSPVPVMKLVEVIPGLKTSPETVRLTEELAASLKKETVRVKDVPGFLVNRINAAFRAEVFNCLLEGVATLEDIDKAVKLGLNHPMGPFELNDAVGIDIGLNVFRTLYDGYKDTKFRPPLVMEKMVQSGDLGKKTGKGWYDYTSGEKKPRKDLNF